MSKSEEDQHDVCETNETVKETITSPLDEVKEMKNAAEKTENGSDSAADCIVVQDPTSDELLEVPTSEGFVLMSTLQASFPGATGLKYKNPKSGANRVVQVDPCGVKLIPPNDGWDSKTYSVILTPQSERVRALSTADGSSAKRRKVGSSDDSDSDDGPNDHGRSGRKRAVQYRERERQPVDLIVLGVDFKTSDESFKSYFDNIGGVVFCEIKRKPDGASKGFGFVRMSSIEEQDKVLAIPQHIIDGRRCDVKVPDGKDKSRPAISRIFVGRLTDAIDEEALRLAFANEAREYVETAVVTDVFIPKPFRGFAFVTLSSVEAADRIVNQGSLTINGVSVGLSLAQPREENQSAGSDYGLPVGLRKRRERERRPLFSNPPGSAPKNVFYSSSGPGGPPPSNRDRYWGAEPRNSSWY